MRRSIFLSLLALGMILSGPTLISCQEPSDFLAVGEPAPDIEIRGATRYGVLADPVRLSELRGETIVLAFFFRARTGG